MISRLAEEKLGIVDEVKERIGATKATSKTAGLVPKAAHQLPRVGIPPALPASDGRNGNRDRGPRGQLRGRNALGRPLRFATLQPERLAKLVDVALYPADFNFNDATLNRGDGKRRGYQAIGLDLVHLAGNRARGLDQLGIAGHVSHLPLDRIDRLHNLNLVTGVEIRLRVCSPSVLVPAMWANFMASGQAG